MKRGLFLIPIMVVLVIALIFAGCSQPAPAPAPSTAPVPKPAPASSASPATAPSPAPAAAQPIKLKMLSFLAKGNALQETYYPLFVNKVSERAKGQIIIESVGGPEATPIREQPMALQKGIVDLLFTSAGFFKSLVPCSEVLPLSLITPAEERKGGAYDYLLELYKAKGIYFLGRGMASKATFYICANKKLQKPEDIAGLKIAVGTKSLLMLKEFKATPVPMTFEEIYTAMERKVIDGYSMVIVGAIGYGWHEVTKYVVDHPYSMNTGAIFVNLNSWNKLPKNLQDLLTQIIQEAEQEGPALYEKLREKEIADMKKAGVEFIKFAPEDAKRLLDTYYRTEWEEVLKADKENAEKLRKLVGA